MGIKRVLNSRVAAVGAGAAALAVLAGGVGYAAGEITSHDIQDDTIRSADVKDESLKMKDLTNGVQQQLKGEKGKDGKDGMFGAVYRVANYENGGGGRATVACADETEESKQYTAIAGGARVEVRNEEGAVYTTDTVDITSSFPGRMDWDGPNNAPGGGDDNLPYPNRLDGWVVYFGDGTAPGPLNDGTLEVWALCVPTTDVDVEVTNY